MSPARVRNVPAGFWVLAFFFLAMTHAPVCVHAQSGQEKIIQQRLERAGSLDYEPAGKTFATTANVGSRQASVRSFAFGGRSANTKMGDGAFHARTFDDGRGSFRTDKYAVRRASAVDRQALPQADRTFATNAVPVREDRAANRSIDSRDYVNSTKPYLVPGKRQDSIDELRRQKNLTVDQVREILNKSK